MPGSAPENAASLCFVAVAASFKSLPSPIFCRKVTVGGVSPAEIRIEGKAQNVREYYVTSKATVWKRKRKRKKYKIGECDFENLERHIHIFFYLDSIPWFLCHFSLILSHSVGNPPLRGLCFHSSSLATCSTDSFVLLNRAAVGTNTFQIHLHFREPHFSGGEQTRSEN